MASNETARVEVDETSAKDMDALRIERRRTLERKSRRRKLILLVVLLLILAGVAYTVWFFARNKTLPLPRIAGPTASAIPAPQFLYNISGTGKDSLDRPIGVAVGPQDRIYVSDLTMKRVSVFTSDGKFLFSFKAISDGQRKELMSPVHIAFDNKNELWVTDRSLDAAYVFSPDGKFIRKFKPLGQTPAEVKKFSPLALTFSSDGKLYLSDVGDTDKHRMLVYDPAGDKVAEWGKTAQVDIQTDKAGQFYYPNGIALSPSGRVFVADGNNRRIQVFDAKGKFERFIKTSGIPRGTWYDVKNGRLFVTDALAHEVDIFDAKTGDKLVTFGSSGSGPGQFAFPNDIALDSVGKVYVADRENHQVQVWGWPQPVVKAPTLAEVQRWGWCLSPLLLLPLLLLFRKREFTVTGDFVDALAASGHLRLMDQRKLRWVTPIDEYARFRGRVEDGIHLETLIQGAEHSDADARDMAERMDVDMPIAVLLSIAARSKRLATEDPELRKLALLVGIDVYDRAEFLDRFGDGERS